jgi:uncharacterized protein (DUF2236 family)
LQQEEAERATVFERFNRVRCRTYGVPVMLKPQQRERLVEMQDRLIDLFVQHDEAKNAQDWERVRALQTEIDTLRACTNGNGILRPKDEDFP